jgi:signal transduction histidine kinase
VEAGDRERARLERDLHDGAQQRLAGLALAVRVARSGLVAAGSANEGESSARAALTDAETEVMAAIADVREVAHGIYPAVLADMGLGPAVVALAETGAVVYVVEAMPVERLPMPVEATAYLVIAEAPSRPGAVHARVRGEVVEGRLRVRLVLDGVAGRAVDLTDLEDRVGALEGSLAVTSDDETTVIEMELPCAS